MSTVTIEVPDELAEVIANHQKEAARILASRFRNRSATSFSVFDGEAEIYRFMADRPTPEQILELKPSPRFQRRIDQLLAKSKSAGLDSQEADEWRRFQVLTHVVRVAKAHASQQMGKQADA
jgi:hypothetical protein